MRSALRFLAAFSAVAVGLGLARALTTSYVPVLLHEVDDNPAVIGAVMLVNALAGFFVPLAAGWWSDRRGTRSPFILGGAIVSAGGLVAIALGNASSYFALTLAAATVYIGLNAATTAHRAIVAERFEDERRPRATGAQEIALLLGALVGTVMGGALVETNPALLFAIAGVAVLALAAPTLLLSVVRRRSAIVERERPPRMRDIVDVARTPGAREVLLAQILWVFAYIALPPFMILYAAEVLSLGAATAGLVLAAFGLLTGAGMLVAARLPAERVRTALHAGTLALGAGLLLALPASSLAVAAAPFALAGVGAGVVTALGFPYFARFIPRGEEGAFSGAFFSGRAIALTAALPSAGGLIALTGSYRALLGMGLAAVVAAIPLSRAEGVRERKPRLEPLPHRSALRGVVRAWAPRLTLGVAAIIAIGAALPTLQGTDERAFREIQALGHGPEWIYQALDPHSRNYAILVLIALVVGITFRRARFAFGAALALVFAAFASDAVLEIGQILFDRPRPEEAIGAEANLIDGRSWDHIPSYPSGHLMVTAAMVAALVKLGPRWMRWPLLGYLAAIAITRITFGAHFPLDVLVGGVVGWQVGVFSIDLLRAGGLLPRRAEAPEAEPALIPEHAARATG